MLQAAHARAAFICVWDDHETANDSWMHGAENHQPDKEGDWETRKAAAMQAYFEWMPIRDPIPGKPWDAINRSFAFGNLATLMMVETRLLARDLQAGFKGATPSAAAIGDVLAERNRPGREMLGEPQRKWLEEGLAASVKAGIPWQIIGNQVVMARVEGPDLAKLFGADRAQAMVATLNPGVRGQVEAAQVGYRARPAVQSRRLTAIRPRASGSMQASAAPDRNRWCWPATATPSGRTTWPTLRGRRWALEFGTSSISVPRWAIPCPTIPLGDLLEKASPEVTVLRPARQGAISCSGSPRSKAVADYVAMATIYAPDDGEKRLARCLRRGRRRHSGEGVTQAGGDVRDNSPGRTGVGMNFPIVPQRTACHLVVRIHRHYRPMSEMHWGGTDG